MQQDKAYIFDILEAARLTIEYIGNKSKDEFLKDIQCQDAIVRRFAIIIEAARRISGELKSTYPEIPWNEMIGMRNVMIHEYDDVDMVIVWDTVKKDIPALISAIEKVLP
jgi:uncharacterized protein with HEPN domain